MTKIKREDNKKIILASSFARSTNIEIDYNDSSKLKNIYLTNKFEMGLSELLTSTLDENSNHRVRVLSGSPGLGKSTFALLASNLLSKSNPRLIKDIIEYSSSKNAQKLKDLYQSFQKSKKTKLLPVFINGYMGNIEDIFIEKLQSAMIDVGLEKEFSQILKKSSQNHISIIKKWNKSFPEIYSRYCDFVEAEGLSVSEFEKKLKKGSSETKDLFNSIFSEITGGASTANSGKSDVIELYKQSINILSKKGFAGIFVVYDEFGKYLEKGIHNPSLLNVQFLQDFAEYCDRSGKGQCHLTLITHLSVSQYASKLPINIQKEWAKIEGRFQESSFYDRNTNHYKMISLVFEKPITASNKKIYTKWMETNSSILKAFKNGKVGLDKLINTKECSKIVEKCYPLHPVALALLPSLSQKVAQNERTLYTFLTRDEDYSLKRYIEENDVLKNHQLLNLSNLYDYFSPLIAKDTGIGGNYKVQLMYEEACNKVNRDNIVAKEIISLTSLLSVIKDSNFAPISEDFICASLSSQFSTKEIKSEIKNLISKKVLLENKVTNQYELVEGSSIDIDEEIDKLKKKKLASKDLVQILKNYVKPSYITPNKYNFEHNIIRYYRSEIVSFEELVKIPINQVPNYGKEDGVVYYVIPFSKDELDQARAHISKLQNQCTAFILPSNFVECKADLEELNAVNALFTNKEVINSGPLAKKELDRHKEILIESITKIVNNLLGNTHIDVKCYYPKENLSTSAKHFSQLNRFLGNIFEIEYKFSIDFNSEYSNRNKITGNIALARKVAIDAMNSNLNQKNFGLEGNGPEVAIVKALKRVTSLKVKDNSIKLPRNSAIDEGLKHYKKLICTDTGATSETITNYFLAPPFGIRKGILPLIISVWDKSLESPVSHYYENKFVTCVDGDHYDMLLKQPKHCKIQFTEISKAKRDFIKIVGNSFLNSKVEDIQDLLSTIYSWRKTIPESTKLSQSLSKEQKKLLICIDSAQEPGKLVFQLIPESLGFSKITKSTKNNDLKKIESSLKNELNSIHNVYPTLISDLNLQLVESIQFIQEKCLGEKPFEYSKGMNLAKIFQATLSRLNDSIKNYPYSKTTSKFLGRVKGFDSSKHPQYFIETVADSLTNANPRNWDIKGKAMFEFTLNQAINEIETVVEYISTEIGGESAIAFIQKESGEKDFIRLGITTELSKDLRSRANDIEDALSDLSQKDKNNLLINLLKQNSTSISTKQSFSTKEGTI